MQVEMGVRVGSVKQCTARRSSRSLSIHEWLVSFGDELLKTESMTDPTVSYYGKFDEWARLETDAGAVELERTLALIDISIPAPAKILDLGGGPGRYTLAMAERGHHCQLVDISSRFVEEANARISRSPPGTETPPAIVGNATDLSAFEDASFDGILALGPFYHLTKPAERIKAANECFRVLRPGGTILAAFIPKISGVADLVERAARAPDQVNVFTYSTAVSDGIYNNPSPGGFQSGCFMTPNEAGKLFCSSGFQLTRTVSIRSILYGKESAFREIARNEPALAKTIQEHADELATEESIASTCGHALVVAIRPNQ